MFDTNKNNKCQTRTALVFDAKGTTVLAFTGKGAFDVLSLAKSAPKYTKIAFKNGNIDPRKVNFTSICEYLSNYIFQDLDLSIYNELIKGIQAQLANCGYQVVQVYGIKLNNKLYGYDFGFELYYDDKNSIYVDFNLIYKDVHLDTFIIGASLFQNKSSTNNDVKLNYTRHYGRFLNSNEFIVTFPNNTPSLVSDLIGMVPVENVNYLTNLSVVVDNLYSDLPDNCIKAFMVEDKELKSVLATALISAEEIGTKTRASAANLFKEVALSENPAGLSNVASMKFASASVLENLGDLLLVETVPNGIIQAEAERIEVCETIKAVGMINNANANALIGNTEYTGNKLGSVRVITQESLTKLVGNLINQQASFDNNADLHLIYAESNELIGFLSNGNQNVVYDSSIYIESNKLEKLVIKDRFLERHTINNIAVDSLNAKETIDSLEQDALAYKTACAAINLTHIQNSIRDIDSLVTKAYDTLASLTATSTSLTAQAKTLIQASELILKLKLQTAYQPIEFGTVAEFIKIEKLPGGRSKVSKIEGLWIPYQPQLTKRQCGRNWITMNASPGFGYNNDILIGPTLANAITDTKGKGITTITKSYEITPRQTRGSGDCEQEVVARRCTPNYVVQKLDTFLDEIVIILESILNDDKIIALSMITDCIFEATNIVKRYTKKREPFLAQLSDYFSNQEQLFLTNHMLNLVKSQYNFNNGLHLSSNTQLDKTDRGIHGSFDSEQIIHMTNHVTQALEVADISINTDITSEFKEIKDEVINYCIKINNQLKLLESKTRDAFTVKLEEKGILNKPQLVEEPTNKNDKDYNHKLEEYNNYLKLLDNYYKELDELLDKSKYECHLNLIINFDYTNINGSNDIGSDTIFAEAKPITKMIEYYNDENIHDNISSIILACNDKVLAMIKQYIHIKNILLEQLANINVVFDGRHVTQINLITNEYNEFTIEFDSYKIKYSVDYQIEKQNKMVIIEITPIEFVKLDNFVVTPTYLLSIGSFMYELSNILKHEYIFGCLPVDESIISKISYACSMASDTSYSEVFKILERKYNTSIAQYYSSYISKIPTLRSFYGTLVFAAIANPTLFVATIMSYQEKQLGILLKDNGFNIGNASSFKHEIMKLSV